MREGDIVRERLRDLVDSAYGAVLNEARLVPWVTDFIDTMEGAGGTLAVVEVAGGSCSVVRRTVLNVEPNVYETYVADGLWQFDPQVAQVGGMTGSGLYTNIDHADPEDPGVQRHESYLESEVGWRHYITAVAAPRGARSRAALSIHRHAADGVTPRDVRDRMAAVLPEVVRALELGLCHAEKMLEPFWDGVTSGRKDPALLLDERGRVMRITRGLERCLARSGLDIVGDRLAAALPGEDAALQAMIARAIRAVAPVSGSTRISRPDGRLPLVLTTYPIARRNRLLAPAEAAALITVVDPLRQVDVDARLFGEALGLTSRETDLAECLMAGHSPESAAALLDVSVATVRVHLRHLLAKAGVSRQIDLLRLLARIG